MFLRPTESYVIFCSSWGGLRKYTDKDYLTVVDFIANYKRRIIYPSPCRGEPLDIGVSGAHRLEDYDYRKAVWSTSISNIDLF